MADITYIPIRQLHPHPDNPRKELGDLSELAASIKENGVYQNLTVIPGHYIGKQEYIARCIADGGDASAAEVAWTPRPRGPVRTTPSSSDTAGRRQHSRLASLNCPALWSI